MNKKIYKKGFTLIELIVVMAVIAILVLLAAPKFSDYIKQARETVIRHDIVVVESALTEHIIKNSKLPSGWNPVSTVDLEAIANAKQLYGREGLVETIETGDYVEVSRSFLDEKVRTNLEGRFIANKEGTVYYQNTKGLGIPLTEKDLDFDRVTEIITVNDESKVKVLSYQFPNGIYTVGDTIKGTIRVQGVQAGNYQINATMIHSKANTTIPMTTSFDMGAGETKTIEFTHKVVVANRLGFYNLEVSVDQGATVLAKYNVPQSIYLGSAEWEYMYKDDFDEVTMAVIGGIGELNPERVSYDYTDNGTIDYSSIKIDISAGSNVTGQVKTKLPITYGTYEANIKVPNSDALLNGFFLYGVDKDNPEITYEIDMEILYYEGKWQLWTTVFNPSHERYTYNGEEPGVIFHKKTDLAFNPSEGYHGYRIDFYRNYTSFALDGNEVARWNDTFDYGEMYLYTGSFYTHWLSKNISTTDKQMDIQWIRRGFDPR